MENLEGAANQPTASPPRRHSKRIWLLVLWCVLLLVPLGTWFIFRWFSAAPQQPSTVPSSSVPFQGHHYEVFQQKVGWHEAKRLCEGMGGHLACITSENEQRFVVSYLLQHAHPKFTTCWLGGTDEEKQGIWQWITGEEMTLTSYLLLTDPTEHYLNLRLETGMWEDYREEGERVGDQWFLCEWEK